MQGNCGKLMQGFGQIVIFATNPRSGLQRHRLPLGSRLQ